MAQDITEERLHALTTTLVNELITLTPESMAEIQFEIVATADGGADIGLLENHPDAAKVALSDVIYHTASEYLPLVKTYLPGWTRSLIEIRQQAEGWQVSVDLQHA